VANGIAVTSLGVLHGQSFRSIEWRTVPDERFVRTKVYETPLMEVNQINNPERRAATIEMDIPLSDLKSGFYTCQVNVIDNIAGQFVFPRLALLVR
jgi:hypothetical protein